MHLKKTLLLVAVVAILGLVVARQLREKDDGGAAEPGPIARDVDWARVDRIRIENGPRNLYLTLERDRAGYWYITDPVAAKARDYLVREIFDAMLQTRAFPAPELDRASVGLDPPVATIDFFVDGGDGEAARTRVEIGALDLVDEKVHLFCEGRLLRASRRVFNLVERSVKDFRETQVLPTLGGVAVIGYVRRGALVIGPSTDLVPQLPDGVYSSYGDGERLDLGLVATKEGVDWVSTAPFEARLSTANCELLFGATARLQAAGFVEGLRADLAALGLDDPAFAIQLELANGDMHTFEFGYPAGQDTLPVLRRSWMLRVDEGDDTYYELDAQIVQSLCQAFEDLVEPALFGVVRDQIQSVTARRGEREVHVERFHGKWMVRVGDVLRPADPGLLSDWLRDVDRVHIDAVLAPDTAVDFTEPTVVEIATADGVRRQVEFGSSVAIANGVYRSVRRAGEQVTAITRTDYASMVDVEPESLLSLRLVGAQAVFTFELSATDSSGRSAKWRRDASSGRWNLGDSDFEDRDFAPLVDHVVAPVAKRWIETPFDVPDDAPWIDVTVVDVDDARTTYRVVDLGDRVVVLWSGLAAELVGRTLYDGLESRLSELASGE
ncbi:MAG: DUF4340 domain-containing protein [Planctomycetota bacterium]